MKKHASLFTGIGGFDLAAQWMGWENVFQVEIDEFCQKVLEKNFPNTKRYGDIKQFNGTEWAGKIDVLTGGFPCQPFSVAGKRKGKEDNRFLWPEMFRAITEIKPRWIVGENVTGIIGLALDQVLASLEGEGYNAETYIIPACAVNAPHRRDRVWIIAFNTKCQSNGRYHNRKSSGIGLELVGNELDKSGRQQGANHIESSSSNAPNTNINRLQRCGKIRNKLSKADEFKERLDTKGNVLDRWQNFPTQSPIRHGNDGISTKLVRSAISAGGNAIVPQVAFEIFKAIEHANQNL